MFFIMGINRVNKPVQYQKLFICSRCGQYGKYEVNMTYMCLSLFFIPIIKWDKHFFAISKCCNCLYELDYKVGLRLKKGEDLEISDSDLTFIKEGKQYNWDFSSTSPGKKCKSCGYKANNEYIYCPKCGEKL